jgi:hypothetical protein
MSRKPKVTPIAPQPIAGWPAVPFGFQMVQLQPPPMLDRNIVKQELNDNKVTLDDGAVISIKLTVNNVKQIIGQLGPAGEPIYTMQLSWTVATIMPPASEPAPSRRKARTGSKTSAGE